MGGLARDLAQGRRTLVDLWGDAGSYGWRRFDAEAGRIEIAALACPEGVFPSIGRHHAPAIRLERALRDLYGLEPVGAPDDRPLARSWALAGAAAARQPQAARGRRRTLRVPAGRRRGTAPDPGRPGACRDHRAGTFPLHLHGETVVRLEERLGYVHKGIEALMRGADARRRRRGWPAGSRATARSPMRSPSRARSRLRSASSRPQRAVWLRALMAELERIANHLGDIGAICNDAAFA